MALIIVFGGYQLVQSLPASHSASSLVATSGGDGVLT